MKTLFKALCNNDLNLPGHSVIKHMHYDSSGSDRAVCEIVSKVAKTTNNWYYGRLRLLNG